jgi:hypothetical protein
MNVHKNQTFTKREQFKKLNKKLTLLLFSNLEVRQNDIKDISLILKHYFDIETDVIYEQHNDLFEDDRDTPLIAARVIGRQMKRIIGRSLDLEKRVTAILQLEIDHSEKSKIAEP